MSIQTNNELAEDRSSLPESILEHIADAVIYADRSGTMPSDAGERRQILNEIRSVVTASGGLGDDAQRRLEEVERLANPKHREMPARRSRRMSDEAPAAA